MDVVLSTEAADSLLGRLWLACGDVEIKELRSP